MSITNTKHQILNTQAERPPRYNSGQAVIVTVVFLLFVSLTAVGGFSLVVLTKTKTTRKFLESKKSYFLSEAGVEDVTYRIMKGKTYDNNESLSLDGSTVNTAVTVNVDGDFEITGDSSVNSVVRKTMSTLSTGAGASFNYGLQIGDGGLVMIGSSSVQGNVYSNGAISASSNVITGDAVSAGASGSIDGANISGDAYANDIINSTIGGDAYYQTISGSTVSGVEYPGSSDQPPSTFPITDQQVTDWEDAAEAVSVINTCDGSGDYVSVDNEQLGPVRINCDLRVKGNNTLILTGTVWVSGKLKMENNPTITVDSGVGAKSVLLIADNRLDRINSSKLEAENSVTFSGSGQVGSYVMLVSMNSSAELGGNKTAIEAENSISGDVLAYAPHGSIKLKNNIVLKEATGYKIELENSAQIIYETGLANLVFDTGPGGGYNLVKWEEL